MDAAASSNATLRQSRYVEYANRTRGNRRIRDKGAERILPWTATEYAPVRNPLQVCAIAFRELLAYRRQFRPCIACLLPQMEQTLLSERQRGAKPPSSGGVEFLGVLEPRGGSLPRSLPCQLGRDGGRSYRGRLLLAAVTVGGWGIRKRERKGVESFQTPHSLWRGGGF